MVDIYQWREDPSTCDQREPPSTQDLIINGRQVPWTKDIKYVGVTIDMGLTFNRHVVLMQNKVGTARVRLFVFISWQSELNNKNKLLLIGSIILSILIYASNVWVLNLQLLENISLRYAVDALSVTNEEIFHELGNTPMPIAL